MYRKVNNIMSTRREEIFSNIESFLKALKNEDSIVVFRINEEDNFLDIGLDSMEFIQLIIFIESEYNIEIPDEYLLQTKLNSIGKVIDVILACLGEKYTD